jgi:hypothetical protein
MEQVQYVYTAGMTAAELEERLRAGEHGVLALADGDEAYAVVLSYHYDGDRLLLRVSGRDPDTDGDDGEKARFLASTTTATLVCYDADTEASWSIHVRGPLSPWEGGEEVGPAEINARFQPFRLFGEPLPELSFELYELGMETVVGRRTVE